MHSFSNTTSLDNFNNYLSNNQNNEVHRYQVYHAPPGTIFYHPPPHVILQQQQQPLLSNNNNNNNNNNNHIITTPPPIHYSPAQLPPIHLNPLPLPLPLPLHLNPAQQQQQEQEGGNQQNEEPPQVPVVERAQIVRNHRLVLSTIRGRRHLHAAIGSVVFCILGVLMSTVAPWFETKDQQPPQVFYCKDDYLFVFLVPPLFCVPLLLSSLAFVGRLCWWHCWTVTVISIGVPAGVVFVSFGSSLVTRSSSVEWSTGSYFVILAYLSCVVSGLLFMKLAHLIENGIPINNITTNNEDIKPHPITVHIGVDDDDIPKDGKYFIWDDNDSTGSGKD